MKIAVCGLVNSENLGEKFISRSLIHLLEEELEKRGVTDLSFREVDIRATKEGHYTYRNPVEKRMRTLSGYSLYGLPLDLLDVRLKRIVQSSDDLEKKNRISRFRHALWRAGRNFGQRYRRYFDARFAGADVIVIDGAGLLEYSWNEYQEPLLAITLYAEKHGIPVFYNAIGRAGEYDPKDTRCRVLMRALRSDAVKYISARDSLRNVQNCAGKRKTVRMRADAAFTVSDAFSVRAEEERSVIGIGLIRGNALTTYRRDFSEEAWIELFAGIARELDRRGCPYMFFTNGEKLDEELGRKVLARLGLPETYLAERPTDAEVLLHTIAGFRGLITCRMHSSIAAFSMGIPSVILSWNDKVDKYMKEIGCPERAIDLAHFEPVYVCDALEKALEEGVSPAAQARMCGLARQSAAEIAGILTGEGAGEGSAI